MKNRIITTALLALMATSVSFATGATGNKNKVKKSEPGVTYSITGTAIDKTTGESLAGVLIKVDETGATVYSDFEGNFELSVAPGKYSITTSLISYKSADLAIEADGSTGEIILALENVTIRK